LNNNIISFDWGDHNVSHDNDNKEMRTTIIKSNANKNKNSGDYSKNVKPAYKVRLTPTFVTYLCI